MNLAQTWQPLANLSSPPPIYFDPARNCYWIQNTRGDWITMTETSIRRGLKRYLATRAGVGEPLSPMESFLELTQFDRDIAYAGPLSGTDKGIMEFQGKRILVTESPKLLTGAPGDWPVLKSVLTNVFVNEQFNQLDYFYGWLKIAREALFAGTKRPGQLLTLAGPHDCGKSLVQGLITRLIGGRAAKPYEWMMGFTSFNSDLFGSEHLTIEDEAASYDIRARRVFGAKIKEVTVNMEHRCHAKHRPGILLPPFWRLSITVNSEPENLMILPPLDESLADKMILLRAYKNPMPLPTRTTAERLKFMDTLVCELPAFCAFLDGWQIPDNLISERFGITHFHHPELIEAIDALAPEAKLWQIIETDILSTIQEWSGSAADLEHALTKDGGQSTFEVRRILTFSNACGVYLGRLEKKFPDRVHFSRTSQSRFWTLKRDPDLPILSANGSGQTLAVPDDSKLPF